MTTLSPPVLSPARRDDSRIFTVSVLMSTYAAESASNLEAALDSIERQSVRPNQLVLVIDGPICGEQEAVIARHCEESGIATILVRLPHNRGLAEAMNAGLKRCTGEFVMRMDSDDISEPDRVERQLIYAQAHRDIDVISSWSEEFFEDGAPSQLKVSPTSHDAIIRALHWRNILVHPTVLIKKTALVAVDGYRATYGRLEDYDLFVRLALAGAKFHVIPKALVKVRSSTAQRGRRGGLNYVLNEMRFRFECLRTGFLTKSQFVAITLMYSVFRLVSGPVRRRLYALART
ncbi:glycosyltransferase [Microvirga antarctica]|uniref:glycosyltransferase n=1 Tax=Microvirga antarctica TaxID=2819233 RepID=UPI001FE4ADDB|nr:glycosyltransferase [Microvirga antarctica]